MDGYRWCMGGVKAQSVYFLLGIGVIARFGYISNDFLSAGEWALGWRGRDSIAGFWLKAVRC